MSEKIIDIGTQSTVDKILSTIPGNIDFHPMVTMNQEIQDRLFRVGKIPNCSASISPIVLFYNDNVYVIPHDSMSVYMVTNDSNCWREVVQLPFEIDAYNTRVLIFNNPDTRKNELHILGGKGRLSRTHFKYDLDGDDGVTIASTLPYDFCAGKAVVYKNEIHIFGGGTAEFSTSTTAPDGFENNHYKWNGLSWERASALTVSCYGATPFVLDNELLLLGGESVSDNSTVPVYRYNIVNHIWNTMGSINLSPVPFHSSIVSSQGSFMILGGITTAYQTKVEKSESSYGNYTFSISSTSVAGLDTSECYSGQSVAIDEVKNIIYSASRGLLYITSGNVSRQYKSIYYSKDFDSENWNLLVLRDTLVVASLGESGKELISLDSGNILYAPFNMSKNCISVNDNGDIYMFNDSVDKKQGVAYIKTEIDGEIIYEPHTFSLSYDIENPYVCWYHEEFHIIGKNKTGYNHCIVKDYKTPITRGYILDVTLPEGVNQQSMCVHNDMLYYAYILETDDGKFLRLYKFDGSRWVFVGKEELDKDHKYDIKILSFQRKLFILKTDYLDSDSTTKFNLSVLVGANFVLMNECELDMEFTNMDAVVFNNCIHMVCIPKSNSSKLNRYALQYSFTNSTGVDSYEIFLDEGRVFVCDKNEFVPIIGYVEEVSNGFKALTTGKYTFIKVSNNQ